MAERKRVVIIGGGFAGLAAARRLSRAPVDVTLIDSRNFHLFQPLLYQVATGGLSPGDIASPLRGVLAKQKNVKVLQATVTGVDAVEKLVFMDSDSLEYDYLLVATGSTHHYFGNDSWADLAPGLKTIEDALEMRRKIFSAFEQAERESDPGQRQALMTFVIVGGGPTGVELAGALGELAHQTLRHDFRNINVASTKIVLIEATDRLLQAYDERISERAAQSLRKLGVDVRKNTRVENLDERCVTVVAGDQKEVIPARTVLWGAGVQASSLGKQLADATGAKVDRQGRLVVEEDLSIAGHADILVLGDLANFEQDGRPVPGVAPVAMQQGSYAAKLIIRRMRGRTQKPFRYKDRGNMAVIGRAAAVAEIGRLRFHGFWAWLLWLFVHLINIVEFQNRMLVLIQWGWNYFTRNRSARLITFQGESRSGSSSDGEVAAPDEQDSEPAQLS